MADGTSGGTTTKVFDPNAEATACYVSDFVFAPSCLACHGANAQVPDLTFDALAELIASGTTIVPGDPDGSLLYRKVAGTQAANEGTMMPPPPSAPLDAARVELVRRWILEGATVDCTPGDITPGRYHPEGFNDPSVHGIELKLGPTDCRECHGMELTGGAGPSCDSCHMADWRTNCTYCHGGANDTTGAPPRDLSGVTNRPDLSFRPHSAHVSNVRHPAFDCAMCHVKPDNVTSVGHIFDATRGIAEVDFSGGLSPAGAYEGEGSCANLYCHGNGQRPGAFAQTMAPPACDGCHAGPNSGRTAQQTMSEPHFDHLRDGVECTECHALTIGANSEIVDPDLHVNGTRDVSFANTAMSRSTAGTCSGTCHNERHNSRTWQ